MTWWVVARCAVSRWVLIVVAATLLAIAGAAGLTWRTMSERLNENFGAYDGREQFVEITRGLSVSAIGDRLAEAGVVRDPRTFRLAMWLGGDDRGLQAGDYRFDRPMRVAEVIDRLVRGDVYLQSITFPEGLDLEEMAAVFERFGFGSAADFLAIARDPAPVADLDAEANDLEGYLFPDTYHLPRGVTAADVVQRMVRGFREAWSPELRAAAAAAGASVRDVVALASLVEKETARDDERPIVSGVYTNRLRIGMGLQCDPTVIYALKQAGLYDGNLTRANLTFDSPYNTYRYPGLPPGPIASPGRASLEAAVAPADVDYLYFVSRNDGSHEFARTLREHNRNVQEYQVRYFRNRRE